MNNKNESKNTVAVEQTITEYTHLIDLPAVKGVLNRKIKGNNLSHPNAGIRTLSVFFHKNGLSNLL
ncbi:hypothetical protein [Pedobacter suwonensis]|uniref:hypothetical protein n=1 Tax=Pedobacter suwonensis TaxID=332999 RepID=UPI0011A887EE|nr:hypothetical protein [Pedobacter suwonensis]